MTIVPVLAVLAMSTALAASARPERSAALEMRLVPATRAVTLGDSLEFALEFRNRSRDTIRFWFAKPLAPENWYLALNVRRPWWRPARILAPAVRLSMQYPVEGRNVVVLRPGDACAATLRIGGVIDTLAGHGYAAWEVFDPAVYAEGRATGTYRLDSEPPLSVFDRAGAYRIVAELDVGGAIEPWALAGGDPKAPVLFRGRLRAPPAEIRITTRHP